MKDAREAFCIIGSIIGIAGLLLVAQFLEPRQVAASDITLSMLGEVVKACGFAEDIRYGRQKTDFALRDSDEKIPAVYFKDQKIPDRLCIIGQVSIYNRKLQLIAERLLSVT